MTGSRCALLKAFCFALLVILVTGGVMIVSGNQNRTVAQTAAAAADAKTEAGEMAPRSIGEMSAPVTINEFASLTCPHCGDFHKKNFEKLKAEYVDTGKVRIVFNDFPLNKPALDAVMIARCLPEDRFVGFISLLYTTQDKWVFGTDDYLKGLRQDARLAGMSDADFDKCLADEALQKKIADKMSADSKKYDVNSTPTFVFNGGKEKITGDVPYEELKAAIDKLLSEKGSKKAE